MRFSLSYRDVEELLAERGLRSDHSPSGGGSNVTPQKFSADCDRSSDRPTTVGGWMRPTSSLRANGCIYTGLSTPPVGQSTSFFRLNGDAAAAERFLAKALRGENHPAPRVINTDKHADYRSAIAELKADGVLDENSKHRPVQYLNNILEQDHRAIKRRIRASQHFRSFWGAWRTIAGYEAIHMIRKGEACCSVGLLVYCTTSFSVCSRRRTKMPIIYPDFRLDYKIATHPFRERWEFATALLPTLGITIYLRKVAPRLSRP
jgi:transposase, IS6 family